MSDYDPIEIRMHDLDEHYRRFMNHAANSAHDSEYGMRLMQIAAVVTLADAIEYLGDTLIKIIVKEKEDTDV